jgi:hypothetical protein
MAEKDFTKVLDFLGFVMEDENETQKIGTCPFCGKPKKFYVNKKNYKWDCKPCGKSGNIWTLLTEMCALWFANTPESKWMELSRNRGIPVEAFKVKKFCWNGVYWCLPAFNEEGTYVKNVYKWVPEINRVYGLDEVDHWFFGAKDLVESNPGAIVWVTEGIWDWPAWSWFLKQTTNHKNDVVVGNPGANVFKAEWAAYYRGKNVRLGYDNDGAGEKGSWKIGEEALLGKSRTMQYICWPDTFKEGYDLRDLVKGYRARGLVGDNGYKQVHSLMSSMHKRYKEFSIKPQQKAKHATTVKLPEGPPPTFKDVLEVFGKWLRLTDEFKYGLAVSLAVGLANEMPGEMLWMYLVGPASSGKSQLLGAMSQSDRVVFHSSIRPKSLVSGWANGPDPSLLPTFDRKTAIIKDGTLILQSRAEDRQDVFSVLRDAYDGKFKLQYGHGPLRDYPDLRFNILIGVTPVVHGENQSEVGERFLRCEMGLTEEQAGEQTLRAIQNENDDKSVQMGKELSLVCTHFLSRPLTPEQLVKLTPDYIDKFAALAHLCAFLRASVSREIGHERELRYKPVVESPSRLGRQFAKLARMICAVFDKQAMDAEAYALVRKVAFDSCNQFNLDIARTLLQQNRPMTVAEIGEKIGHSPAFVRKRVDDLVQLRMIVQERDSTPRPGGKGAIPWMFKPVQYVKELWDRSKVYTPKKKVVTATAIPATVVRKIG